MTAAPTIPLCVPHLTGKEQGYLNEALRDNWVSYVGPHVDRFEASLAQTAGSAHCVAVNSGTSALHIALLLAGVTAETEVLMPAVSFVAPANAVRYCGAWPVFTDVREDDWQMDLSKATSFLREGCEKREGRLVNKQTGRTVSAILLVHLLGGMGDVDGFAALASTEGLPLIEDAAECLGGLYQGRPIGVPCPAIAPERRFVITSFNGNKVITTGGGGALFTESTDIARRAKHLSTTAKADPIEFYHDEVGYNYRLTNLSAAFGLGQLEGLCGFLERKRAIAKRYHEGLRQFPMIVAFHPEPFGTSSTFWMYTVLLDRPARPIVDYLIGEGIQARPVWQLLPSLPAFVSSFSWRLDHAARLCSNGISLPCSTSLTEDEQSRVIEIFHDATA